MAAVGNVRSNYYYEANLPTGALHTVEQKEKLLKLSSEKLSIHKKNNIEYILPGFKRPKDRKSIEKFVKDKYLHRKYVQAKGDVVAESFINSADGNIIPSIRPVQLEIDVQVTVVDCALQSSWQSDPLEAPFFFQC